MSLEGNSNNSSSDDSSEIGQLETSNSSEEEMEDEYGQFEPSEWHNKFLEVLPQLAKGKKIEPNQFNGELVIPKKKEEKSVKLGDYIRERVLQVDKSGGVADVFEEKMDGEPKETVVQEQERLLDEFKQKAEEVSEDDDLLVVKKKAEVMKPDVTEAMSEEVKEYWKDAQTPEDEFLKKYILEKKWEELEDDMDDVDLDEDQKCLDAMDDFDAEKRLGIVSYGRSVKETLRKERSKRKEQRERRKKRKDEAKRKMAAVVADEKKQQKQKIQQKLLDLNKVAGMNFDDNVLDEEFDPVKFDQMMNNKFNDDYYMEQDDNVEDLRKELAMEMKTDLNDMEGDDEGDNNMEEDNDFGEDINENNGMEMVDDNEVGIERKKNKDSVVIEQDGKREHVDLEDIRGKDDELDQMIEDYYKLDYEDVVDGKKTRFEYVDCKKDDSGLTALDILQLDNKQLNKIISLKKLQPYDNRDLSRGERIKIKKAMDVLLQSNKKPRHSKSSNHPRPQHSHSKAQMKFKQNKQKLLAKKQQIQKKSSK